MNRLTLLGGGGGGAVSYTWTTTFLQALDANGTGFTNRNGRTYISTTLFSTSGVQTRLTLSASSTEDTDIVESWIGDNSDVDGGVGFIPGTKVQVKVGGNGTFTIPAGTSVVTDDLPFVFDKTKSKTFSFWAPAHDTVRMKTGISFTSTWHKVGTNEANVDAPTGYSELGARVSVLSKIEVAN